MTRFFLLPFFGLTFLGHLIFSAESCVWINSATASGILGGPVEVSATHSTTNKDDGVCQFSHRDRKLISTIRIEVIATGKPDNFAKYLARCSSKPSPIHDFGNQAMACRERHRGGESEQIIGHVRDRTFVIRVVTSDKSTSASSLREEARSVAGQVIGNLF